MIFQNKQLQKKQNNFNKHKISMTENQMMIKYKDQKKESKQKNQKILLWLCCHSFLYRYSSQLVTYGQFLDKYDKFLTKKNLQSFRSNHRKYQAAKMLAKGERYKCVICQQYPTVGRIAPCFHIFCEQCVTAHARQILNAKREQETQKRPNGEGFAQSLHRRSKKKVKIQLKNIQFQCETCKNIVKYENLFPTPRLNHFDRDLQQFEYNHKFSMLVHGLRTLKPDEKALIYTNFLGMVQLLEQTMRRQHIVHQVIKGSDSQKSRTSKLKRFQQQHDIKVLIVTLKTGSVGLNLQVANKIYIMDPWWNPFAEDQAIARAHRIGQQKQVHVVTFVASNTIQQRVKQLQSIKKDLFIDLMMDERSENQNKQEDNEEQEQFIKNYRKKNKGKKLKIVQQFMILLAENDKYNKLKNQLKQQINENDQQPEN